MRTDPDTTVGALRRAVAGFVDARDWQQSRTVPTKTVYCQLFELSCQIPLEENGKRQIKIATGEAESYGSSCEGTLAGGDPYRSRSGWRKRPRNLSTG
jgi:hypothetical protein